MHFSIPLTQNSASLLLKFVKFHPTIACKIMQVEIYADYSVLATSRSFIMALLFNIVKWLNKLFLLCNISPNPTQNRFRNLQKLGCKGSVNCSTKATGQSKMSNNTAVGGRTGHNRSIESLNHSLSSSKLLDTHIP